MIALTKFRIRHDEQEKYKTEQGKGGQRWHDRRSRHCELKLGDKARRAVDHTYRAEHINSARQWTNIKRKVPLGKVAVCNTRIEDDLNNKCVVSALWRQRLLLTVRITGDRHMDYVRIAWSRRRD